MDFINGTYRILYIKRDNEYLPIGCLQTNSFSEQSELIGTTTRQNGGWVTSRPTNQSYEIAFSGLLIAELIAEDKITYQDLKDLKRGRTLIDWRIKHGDINPDYGQGYISSLDDAAAIDDFVSFSGSIVGYGEPANIFDNIYFGYKDRVEDAGGTLTSETCTRFLINKWINN